MKLGKSTSKLSSLVVQTTLVSSVVFFLFLRPLCRITFQSVYPCDPIFFIWMPLIFFIKKNHY